MGNQLDQYHIAVLSLAMAARAAGIPEDQMMQDLDLAFNSSTPPSDFDEHGMSAPDANGLVRLRLVEDYIATIAGSTDPDDVYRVTQKADRYACVAAEAKVEAGSPAWWTIKVACHNVTWNAHVGLAFAPWVRVVSPNPDPTSGLRFITAKEPLPLAQARAVGEEFTTAEAAANAVIAQLKATIAPREGGSWVPHH